MCYSKINLNLVNWEKKSIVDVDLIYQPELIGHGDVGQNMLKMAAILKSKMAATGTDEKNGNNLICIPGSLLHLLRPKTQIVHKPATNTNLHP